MPFFIIEAGNSFISIEARNEALLSKLDARQFFSFLSFPLFVIPAKLVPAKAGSGNPVTFPTGSQTMFGNLSIDVHFEIALYNLL